MRREDQLSMPSMLVTCRNRPTSNPSSTRMTISACWSPVARHSLRRARWPAFARVQRDSIGVEKPARRLRPTTPRSCRSAS